jgi:hypothetical protein
MSTTMGSSEAALWAERRAEIEAAADNWEQLRDLRLNARMTVDYLLGQGCARDGQTARRHARLSARADDLLHAWAPPQH